MTKKTMVNKTDHRELNVCRNDLYILMGFGGAKLKGHTL